MWEHYISNNASGFAVYSGTDEMLTYAFDKQPFLETSNPPLPPDCNAGAGAATSGCIPPGSHQLSRAGIVCHAKAPAGAQDRSHPLRLHHAVGPAAQGRPMGSAHRQSYATPWPPSTATSATTSTTRSR